MVNTVTDTPTGVLICPVCQKTRVFSFGAKGKISSHCAKCGRTIMWDFDKKKMWGVKPHIGIGTMKKMSNLICGKFTAGRNYNLTLNIIYGFMLFSLRNINLLQ